MQENNLDNLPIPKVYLELEGDFIEFNKNEEFLICKFPVLDKFFNPMEVVLGGILDAYMDCTMGPLSFLLGEMVVTKTFKAKYIRPVTAGSKFVVSKAWRESISNEGSIYKAELFLDNEELAAISEGLFVVPKKIKF
ncbi:MAG: PaaI family thioesterase [Actinomycetota bacterium]|nr:PaaI family thioesterase [Actinomycetota bacterium]MDA3013560.1 PaaI family thioesterase [Actinomycetota bacterium]